MVILNIKDYLLPLMNFEKEIHTFILLLAIDYTRKLIHLEGCYFGRQDYYLSHN